MRSADIDDRMRCAVDGCSPVYCAICFSPSGSGCCASTSSNRIMRSMTWIGLFCSSLAGIASHFTACRIARHAGGDLHRRSARAVEEAGGAGDFRLRRSRLLQRSDAAREPRRPGVARAAPARRHRRRPALAAHHHARARGAHARGPRAGRPHRPQLGRRRNPRRARRRALRRALHALHHVDLLDRGRGRRRDAAVLVPALRDARPRLRRLAHRARESGEVLRAGAHARPADPGPAPPGPEERARRAAARSPGVPRSTSCANRAGR